jgi:hypothetical protein
MCVILSCTFGPITGAIPIPPPFSVSFEVHRARSKITVFEFYFTQNGLPIVLQNFTSINDSYNELGLATRCQYCSEP